MLVEILSTVAGIAGAFLSASIGLPQAIRAVRVSTAGVSPTTFQIGCAVAITWAGYGWAQGFWLVFIGNAILGVSAVAVLWALWRDGTSLWNVSALILPMTFLSLLVASLSPTSLMWLGGAMSIALRVPQMRMVRSAESIHGVSIHTWIVSTASAVAWILYGALHGDYRMVVVCMAVSAINVTLILGVQARRRHDAIIEDDVMASPV